MTYPRSMKQMLKEAEMAHSFSLTWTNQVAAAQRKRENDPISAVEEGKREYIHLEQKPKEENLCKIRLAFLAAVT